MPDNEAELLRKIASLESRVAEMSARELSPEEAAIVVSRLATHDVRFGLSEKPARIFRKLHALAERGTE